MVPLNNPLFRPPAEADSLILQVDQGCPHNRCTFCGMYREVPYRRRPLDELLPIIAEASRRDRGVRRIFLADGDVMRRPFNQLEALLRTLNDYFPRLARVSAYANGSSIAAKSPADLQTLRSLKLHTLYMGLESGDDAILRHVRKGETAEQMIRAGTDAQAAGLRMSVMILLGLGGADESGSHIAHTAAALNRMQPRLLSALRMIPVPGTDMYEAVEAGGFRLLTEWQAVRELRDLVARLDLTGTVFRANHSSNVIPLEARLPRDKHRLLGELDSLLASRDLDRGAAGRMPLWL